MPSVNWYLRRLRAMSTREIAWRVGSALRDTADRVRYPLVRTGVVHPLPTAACDCEFEPGFSTTEIQPGAWATAQQATVEHRWTQSLSQRADAICENRLTFFDRENQHLGDPVDWNRDCKSGVSAGLTFAPRIDYRDALRSGDCKFVWEPNRHHQFVVLGRAYRATGDTRYADAFVAQLESWLDACPFGMGMNWRSPLELGIRLINWTWAFDLFRPSGCVNGKLLERFIRSVSLHVWEIERKYSRGSSANNHLIGEAAGVYIACAYFKQLPDAAARRARALALLQDELRAQVYVDGGSREQASAYHRFVLEFYLCTCAVATAVGDSLDKPFIDRLHAAVEFLAALAEGGDCEPMLGDADDGYVLPLTDPPAQTEAVVRVGRRTVDVLRGQMQFTDDSPALRWLPRPVGVSAAPSTPTFAQPRTLASRAFPETGYYLLQSGRADDRDRVSVGFDCGPLGFGSIAAHGHADALSVTLRAFGDDILVDPGTYDYFSHPDWRAYFRSTAAHNTIELDGQDQSIMEGGFLWGARAAATCIAWKPTAAGGTVVGEHDGYRRFADPVTHRRSVSLDANQRLVTIVDEIAAQSSHRLRVFFHTSELCSVTNRDNGAILIESPRGSVKLTLDPSLTVSQHFGEETPICGWVSRGYHRKAAASTVIGHMAFNGPVRLTTYLELLGKR